MTKRIFLALLAIVTVVCILIGLGIHTGFFRNGFSFQSGDVEWGILVDKDVSTEVLYSEKEAEKGTDYGFTLSEDIKSLIVESEILDVQVKEGEDFHIEYTGTKSYRPSVAVKDGELSIVQKSRKRFGIHFSVPHNELRLTLPKGIELDALRMASDTGDIEVKQLQAGQTELKSDTGGILLERFSTGDLDLQSDTGGVTFTDISAGGTQIKTDTGKVNAHKSSFGNLTVKTDTGTVELTDCSMEDADIRTDTGEVRITRCKLSDTNIETDTGAVEITDVPDSENCSLDLSSDTGSITVDGEKVKGTYRQKGGDLKITVRTDTGRIAINGE